MTAPQAAAAIAAGVRAAAAAQSRNIDIDFCPMSDGGDGFIIALHRGGIGEPRTIATVDAFGRTITAQWLLCEPNQPRGPLGIIESAQAIGLAQLGGDELDPCRANSAGVAPLLRAARAAGCPRAIIGLGGSATIDGGIGLAGALGAVFHNAAGAQLPAIPHSLQAITSMRFDAEQARASLPQLLAACDVDNPLLGEHGAVRVYGPQKGAAADQVAWLEAGLANWIEVCRRAGLDCRPAEPGAGAAGGLGFALRTLLNAELSPGADIFMQLVNFHSRLAQADLVLTGEGRFDQQTYRGKVIATIALAGRQLPAPPPVIALVGAAADHPQSLLEQSRAADAPLQAIYQLTDLAPLDQVLAKPQHYLAAAAERAVAHWLQKIK